MKKRASFFDRLLLSTLLLTLFAIGIHIGNGGEEEKTIYADITVDIKNSKVFEDDTALLIDGKYECETVKLDSSTLHLVCRGKYKEAGFLTSGAKYLSENQPIELRGKRTYIFGRISSIRFYT